VALIHCDFKSEALDTATSVYAIIPEIELEELSSKKEHMKFQTLYLLHGIGDDHTKWVRRTSIERYVKKYKIAVIMPQVDKSFYTDMVYGNKYWTFISEELPKKMRNYFPLSEKREDNFVAGLSMGGYGAFKWALNKPDGFAAAASFSGVLDVLSLFSYENKDESFENTSIQIFGGKDQVHKQAVAIFGGIEKIKDSENDLFNLIRELKETEKEIPKLYQCCGVDDSVYKYNTPFKEYAEEMKVDLTYEEGPGGHTWEYWDESLQKVLEWLPIKGTQV
jgi:S-formylglutathione hydrolase FrmB